MNDVVDVARDARTSVLIPADRQKYIAFMQQYDAILKQKTAEKAEIEKRFVDLESKVESNQQILQKILQVLQELKR